MRQLTEDDIRGAFANASEDELRLLALPLDHLLTDWDHLDFLAWRDPRTRGRGYLIAELGKDPVPSWRHGSRSDAVSMLVRHALLYTHSLSVRAALLETAGRLARSVIAGRLGFNLVDPPWSCVDGRY